MRSIELIKKSLEESIYQHLLESRHLLKLYIQELCDEDHFIFVSAEHDDFELLYGDEIFTQAMIRQTSPELEGSIFVIYRLNDQFGAAIHAVYSDHEWINDPTDFKYPEF